MREIEVREIEMREIDLEMRPDRASSRCEMLPRDGRRWPSLTNRASEASQMSEKSQARQMSPCASPVHVGIGDGRRPRAAWPILASRTSQTRPAREMSQAREMGPSSPLVAQPAAAAGAAEAAAAVAVAAQVAATAAAAAVAGPIIAHGDVPQT